MLTIPEQLLLIALDDATGELFPMPVQALDMGLAGGILMELVLGGNVIVNPEGICSVTGLGTQDSLLAYGLSLLQKEHAAPIDAWLRILAGTTDSLKNTVCRELMEKNILTQQDTQHLWFFTSHSYPMIHGEEEAATRQRLRLSILGQSAVCKQSDAALLGLILDCHLDSALFSKDELPKVRAKLEQLRKGDRIAEAVQQAIEQIQSAVAHIIATVG